MNSTTASAFPVADKSTAVQPKVGVCEVRVLRTNAEIEEVRDVWTLWQDNLNADIDFYLLINRLRDYVVRPHVIMVSYGGRPQAMAIGRIEKSSVRIKFGYKSIGDIPVVKLSLIFGGLLGEHTPEVATAILTSLKESLRAGEAEIVGFNNLPVESEIVKRLPCDVSFLCRDHFTGEQIHWKMTLGCTVEDMYARFSHDRRHQLRRQARAFEKSFPGDLSMRCFREPSELEQMTADVEEIAKATYQRGLGVGFMDNEENRTRVAFEARQGWLRVYVLYLKGRPCAYFYGIIHNNIVYGDAMGFDTQYGKYSPGTYLLSKALEDWCQQGVRGLDFGLGNARYKQQFGNQHWYETTIHVCAAHPRLIALILMSSLNNGLKKAVMAVAGRFNAIEIIKKRWRAKLAPRKDNSQK